MKAEIASGWKKKGLKHIPKMNFLDLCTKITTIDFQSVQNTREKTGTHTKGWNPCLKVGLNDLEAGFNLKVRLNDLKFGFNDLMVGLHDLKVGLSHLKFRFSDLKDSMILEGFSTLNDSMIKHFMGRTCPTLVSAHSRCNYTWLSCQSHQICLSQQHSWQEPSWERYLERACFRVAVGDGLCQEAAPAHGILLVGELPSSELHVQDATLGKDRPGTAQWG